MRHKMRNGVAVSVCLVMTWLAGPRHAAADVFTNVAEASGMKLIYELNIPNQAQFYNTKSVPYVIDHAAQVNGGYDRVGYYLELDTGSGLEWVYVSMDDFAQGRIWSLGLPHNIDNPVAHQTTVSNANIYTNVPGKVTAGTGLSTVNLEMWPGNYAQANAKSIPGASGTVYDFGDQNTGGVTAGHGSFQIHNYGATQTLLAYNDWSANSGSGINDELGIGNNPGTHPDWTHQDNANLYTVKRLQVVVQESTPAITAAANAVDAAHYELVHSLAVPDIASHNNNAISYSVDNSNLIPRNSFGRIGYYVQLDNDWVWVSADAFTQNASQIGVPASNSINGNGNVTFQQSLSNMTVESNKAGVTSGTGINGNIEFWSSNYTAANNDALPGSSNTLFDFDDTPSSGGYGSMQIHNTGAAQTVFAYNQWGSGQTGSSDLGIGSRPTSNPDWTFAENASTYDVKQIQTYVLPNVFVDVAEANSYSTVYGMDVQRDEQSAQNTYAVHYGIDHSLDLAQYIASTPGKRIDRIAYYMELKTPTGERQWIFVSMDAFTDDLSKMGVPNDASGAIWDQAITNVNVYSNVAGINTGNGQTGWIEFWPDNYATGANGVFDYDDNISPTTGGHGSMQIHLPGFAQTLMAYNAWGDAGRVSAIGIGNYTGANPDWTFADNADDYEIANIFVLAQIVPTPAALPGGVMLIAMLAIRRRRRAM